MAFERIFDEVGGRIVIQSDGWSGEVCNLNERFQLDIDFTITNTPSGYDGSLKTKENAYGMCKYSGGGYTAIVGISLEHFGLVGGYFTGEQIQQTLGRINNLETHKPAWGVSIAPMSNVVDWDDDYIYVSAYDYTSIYDGSEHEVTTQTQIKNLNVDGNCYPLAQRFLYATGNYDCIVKTDLPIFETDADFVEYAQSNGTITDKILNIGGDDPEEEYTEQFNFWFIKNKWGHNTRNTDGHTVKQNYRFYPKRKGICFIKHTPTAAEPYDRILYNYSTYDAKYAEWGADADEDFIDHPGDITTHFLSKSISFGSDDYYTKFDYQTNIPLWKDQQDADDYYNGLKDISEAENYAYISRQDETILNPDLPGTDIDEATAMRTNGMRFSYGVRLYEITNIELANLMQEMFDPANVQDVIAGNKLMGANTINSVSGVMYLPFADLSEICELGSLANIKIGSWEAQTAQGKRIISNEGTIDCGSFFYNRTYLDYRDYEPYNLLFVNLPFCGCHQLTISKYLDKTINVSYNVDVCTGGIVAKLTADDILVDIFEGTCGASRPISATDNNAYINSIVGAITGASASASGSIEGITNSVSNVGKAAASGTALAAGGAALSAVGLAGAVGVSGVYTAYQVKNAVDNPPQMHRGSLAGNLGYYLNSKPSFLFFTKKTIRPENELETIGYPSGHGGAVGSFSGFLSCSAFKLADGFTGTDEERAEIMEIMRGGIYL